MTLGGDHRLETWSREQSLPDGELLADLRRHASVPCLPLPPRSSSITMAQLGYRSRPLRSAAEVEGVQSWDEYHSIRDAQMVRRPAARRSLRLNLEVAARSEAQPVPSGSGSDDCQPLGVLRTLSCPLLMRPRFEGPELPSKAAGQPGSDLVPLQRLLLSPEASRLSLLDVKFIIGKVACELDGLHGRRILHRHVSVSTIVVPRGGRGKLWGSRLSPHESNIACERGACVNRTVAARGMEPYLAPELAIVPPVFGGGASRHSQSGASSSSAVMMALSTAPALPHTPACDMWSLGVVLFVLLSGSHVPFGNRGLGQTTIPNMPGPGAGVDLLQQWIQEHLECKVDVVNAMAAGPGGTAAFREMRILGFEDGARDLLLGLLRADPAQRLSAHDVMTHPWLVEAEPDISTARAHELEERVCSVDGERAQQQHHNGALIFDGMVDPRAPVQPGTTVPACQLSGPDAASLGTAYYSAASSTSNFNPSWTLNCAPWSRTTERVGLPNQMSMEPAKRGMPLSPHTPDTVVGTMPAQYPPSSSSGGSHDETLEERMEAMRAAAARANRLMAHEARHLTDSKRPLTASVFADQVVQRAPMNGWIRTDDNAPSSSWYATHPHLLSNGVGETAHPVQHVHPAPFLGHLLGPYSGAASSGPMHWEHSSSATINGAYHPPNGYPVLGPQPPPVLSGQAVPLADGTWWVPTAEEPGLLTWPV